MRESMCIVSLSIHDNVKFYSKLQLERDSVIVKLESSKKKLNKKKKLLEQFKEQVSDL